MHRTLLPLLQCPVCRCDAPLALAATREETGEVQEGELACTGCARRYPVRGGIPRFVPADAGRFANFGFQWRRWKSLQIDRLGGHGLSERRFLGDSRWDPSWLAGRLVLDAGCGAGRFADIAAAHGARVVACDISEAVDACREVTAVHGDRAMCVQASIYDLPLRRGAFDAVYCMGVIQHTPDPAAAMRALPAFLRPGGRLAYNFYEAGWGSHIQVLKHLLRLVTPRLPVGATLALSRALVAAFFPVTRFLNRFRVVRQINRLAPIAAVHDPVLSRDQQYAWTLLDTFDWYGPRHEIRQDHRHVAALLRDAGLVEVESRPGLAWARMPDRDAGPGP